MKTFTLILLACAGLAHAQADNRDAIPRETCDMSSPGWLALELLSSKLETYTVRDLEAKYKLMTRFKKSPPNTPPEFSLQETQEIGSRVKKDWCDFKRRDGRRLTPNCDAEQKKMFLTFHMCAKSLKAYDFAKIQGLSGVGLEQFLNVTLVMARRYYWSGIRRGVYGTESWKLFERLVPTKYREAVKGTDFPLSQGSDLHNIKNKRAAATCILIARGADVRNGLAEYEKDGFSRISDELVEKVFISLLTGSIADRVLDDATVRNLGTIKTRYNQQKKWKSLGLKLKYIRDLPLCMDPLKTVINEMKVTCQLKNIEVESSDVSGGHAGCVTKTFPTTTTMPMMTLAATPHTKQTQDKDAIVTAGYNSNKSNNNAPSKGYVDKGAPEKSFRNAAAPVATYHYQPAPAYHRM